MYSADFDMSVDIDDAAELVEFVVARDRRDEIMAELVGIVADARHPAVATPLPRESRNPSARV